MRAGLTEDSVEISLLKKKGWSVSGHSGGERGDWKLQGLRSVDKWRSRGEGEEEMAEQSGCGKAAVSASRATEAKGSGVTAV